MRLSLYRNAHARPYDGSDKQPQNQATQPNHADTAVGLGFWRDKMGVFIVHDVIAIT